MTYRDAREWLPVNSCNSFGSVDLQKSAVPPLGQALPDKARTVSALRYINAVDDVHGWLHFTTAIGFLELLWQQEERGASGQGIAEIGIHHGKSFLVLVAGARPDERLFAIDLFERQDLNVDHSGEGNRKILLDHLANFFPDAAVELIASPSDQLWSRIPEIGLNGIRFFSIDGGHTRALTLNDLRLADTVLSEDGICALDDVFNTHWTGVVSGLSDYLRSGGRLVPFAFLPNKLMLCRSAQSASYTAHLRAALPTALEKRGCEFFDWTIDIYGERVGTLSPRLAAFARSAEPPPEPIAGPADIPLTEPATSPADTADSIPSPTAARVRTLRSMFDNAGIGLEIGPLHSPVAPKREGFRVEILDHTTTKGLRAKYRDDPHVDTDAIEAVDFVSDGRPLRDVVGAERRYDWIIASHVIEHLPDPIGFLNDCELLLRPGGRLVLAVPDRRKCFDVFRPASTLGALLEAHAEQRRRHPPGTLFDSVAYSARLAGSIAWSDYDASAPDLVGTAAEGAGMFEVGRTSTGYRDAHGWVFTPSSFRLLLHDLLTLGRTRLREAVFLQSPGCEFFMALASDGVGCPLGRHELALAALAEAGFAPAALEGGAMNASLDRDRKAAAGLQAEIGALHAAKVHEAATLHADLAAAKRDAAQLRVQVAALHASTSWRVTAPLRALGKKIGRRR